MKHNWTVYMYTFPNGKKYIGATSKTLAQRQGKDWKRYKLCTSVWNAIEEFGTESIEETILFKGFIEDKEAVLLEKDYIAMYDTQNPDHGYNVFNGGGGVSKRTLTEERKSQLREQMVKLGKANRNRVVSAETRQKQREAKLGRKTHPMSQETKDKISKGNSRENMTEETRLRRSSSKKKKIIATNNTTHEQIVFDCVNDAASYFSVKASSISRWVRRIRKPSNNYTFDLYMPTTTE